MRSTATGLLPARLKSMFARSAFRSKHDNGGRHLGRKCRKEVIDNKPLSLPDTKVTSALAVVVSVAAIYNPQWPIGRADSVLDFARGRIGTQAIDAPSSESLNLSNAFRLLRPRQPLSGQSPESQDRVHLRDDQQCGTRTRTRHRCDHRGVGATCDGRRQGGDEGYSAVTTRHR